MVLEFRSLILKRALVAAALATGFSSAALSANLGGNCCVDLEERIAELEATTVRKGNRKVSLTVSGYVNQTIQYWDDGVENNVYQPTNEEERSRFRFLGNAKIDSDWTAGYLLEIGVRTHQENKADQNVQGPSVIDVRYSNLYLQNKQLGKVSLGLVQSAGYHITELTTANTLFFAKEGLGGWMGSNNSGFFLRKPDGKLSSLRWGNILAPGPGTNKDPGEGDRLNGVRYETPSMLGFVATAFWGDDDVGDVSLKYTGELAGFKMIGGIAYGEYHGGASASRGGAVFGGLDGKSEIDYLGMSGSIMHLQTGLYVHAAYGQQDDRQRRAVFAANVEDQDRLWYLQGGIEQKFTALGKTTIYGEYERDEVGAAVKSSDGSAQSAASLGAGAAFNRISGTDVDTWGVGINQNIESASMDLYIGYRNISADVATSATGAAGVGANAVTSIETFHAVVGGAKIDF